MVTENIAILNYIGQRFGAPGAVPLDDLLAAARCNELLGWLASSVHIAFAQVWRPERFTSDTNVHAKISEGGHQALLAYFDEIEGAVGDGWTVPRDFSAVDSYLLTFFRWGKRIGADMGRYPRWEGLVQRAVLRPAVERALQAEGFSVGEFLNPV